MSTGRWNIKLRLGNYRGRNPTRVKRVKYLTSIAEMQDEDSGQTVKSMTSVDAFIEEVYQFIHHERLNDMVLTDRKPEAEEKGLKLIKRIQDAMYEEIAEHEIPHVYRACAWPEFEQITINTDTPAGQALWEAWETIEAMQLEHAKKMVVEHNEHMAREAAERQCDGQNAVLR